MEKIHLIKFSKVFKCDIIEISLFYVFNTQNEE